MTDQKEFYTINEDDTLIIEFIDKPFKHDNDNLHGKFIGNDLILSNNKESITLHDIFNGIWFNQYKITYPNNNSYSLSTIIL